MSETTTISSQPMVTISADEYFDLRSKAEVNVYMSRELQQVRGDVENLRLRLYELEQKMDRR